MDKKQAANFLGVSERTVENYAKAGKLSVVYLGGKADYKESELKALKTEKETPVHKAMVSIPNESENAIAGGFGIGNESSLMELVEVFAQIAKALERSPQIEIVGQNLWRKLIWNLDEAAIATGYSKSYLYCAIKEGKLRGMKIGRGWKVRPQDLQEYTRSLFGQLSYK